MARFLSPEWFAEATAIRAPPAERGGDRLIVEQVVAGTPDGTVTYRVVVDDAGVHIVQPASDAPAADLTITTTWPVAVGIASGSISAQRALMEGHLRVRGNMARLAPVSLPAGVDALGPLRETTTY